MRKSAAAPARKVLEQACVAAGLDPSDAEPVRLAENQIWRLPGQGVIVRIARSGQTGAAFREVRVARWLAEKGVPAVRLANVRMPIEVGGRPVTFWQKLPPHQHGSHTDVAQLLKHLHALPPPDFELGYLDTFVRIGERLEAAVTLPSADLEWLKGLHQELADAWAERPPGLPDCAVHGDAWPGNLIRTAEGPLVIDLERFSLGLPEWDLVQQPYGHARLVPSRRWSMTNFAPYMDTM
ncbi:aminoglycoside phosphotransferase family protein [Streptomyces sp. NPDC052020]|uniref:aminoglycoside phosphotransferase family protein n=1 Tax=Streptomyces sp. NPDC052020 TaxID=3155677 RepID=UPI00341F704A